MENGTERQDRAREALRRAVVGLAMAKRHPSARHDIALVRDGPIDGSNDAISDRRDEDELGFETEVRGRLVALEAILMSYLAHTALHVGAQGGNMAGFVANAMGDAEDWVIHAAQSQDQTIAETALREMRRISGYIVSHITRHAAPMGAG